MKSATRFCIFLSAILGVFGEAERVQGFQRGIAIRGFRWGAEDRVSHGFGKRLDEEEEIDDKLERQDGDIAYQTLHKSSALDRKITVYVHTSCNINPEISKRHIKEDQPNTGATSYQVPDDQVLSCVMVPEKAPIHCLKCGTSSSSASGCQWKRTNEKPRSGLVFGMSFLLTFG